MKKNFHYLYATLAVVCIFFTASCKKNILDKKSLDQIIEEDVWTDPSLVNAFVNSRYNQIGHGWYSESWVSSMCDESFLTWSRSTEPITQGYVSPSFIGSMNGGHWGENLRRWDVVWRNIGNCNIFFDNVNKVPFPELNLKNRLIGEVTFIRALMYWDLVNRWGAMPLITKSYGIDNVGEISKLKRNTYKENIDFLVAECDKAAAALPPGFTGTNKGRATSVAALALKSRVLLYAASPLMSNARSDDPNFFVHYQTPDAARWQKAADAAQAAITAALANGYALFDKYGADVKKNYTGIFMEGGNSEVIFDRQGGTSASSTNLGYIDEANGPNGYGAWGGNTPTAEFVDDFQMSDGTKFSWNNPVHKANPYANRDARLYATVLSDGDMWKGRKVETFYFKKPDGSETGGLDTKYGSNSWNTSATGYNARKFLDETEVQGSWNFNPKNWIWFRLGELYLNLAEAKFFAADEAGARTALNVIRDRARMPRVTASGTQLWEAIVYERRVELAFEEHRYFDVRRWMIADVVLNKNATGITIVREGTAPPYTYTYSPGTSTALPRLVEVRKFVAPKMYWLPIQLDEMNKNPNLGQNPGYN
ncbi:MAG: RagB/SusD family nutrient uptake outer membrane protein [Ferruginibacter sp.]|nr:RagB/SusD family nutrient uptake outer membrane protein [Ferruginibacter sp.]